MQQSLSTHPWQVQQEVLQDGRVRRYRCFQEGAPLTYTEVIRLWQAREAFRSFFIALLADSVFTAYRWETPPVTVSTVDQPFEWVLVDSPYLARLTPDPVPFSQHFEARGEQGTVVTFSNLGRDAVLVVPCPVAPASAYPQIAAFSRQAPLSQQHELWKRVGATLEARLQDRPLWLSTAGGGVSWLHVRLDARPKYYSFRPYREAGSAV